MSVPTQAATSDRPRYPEIDEDMGEDPARFLSSSERYLPLARILGIRDRGLLSAYRAVELREFGGRDAILEAIDEREHELMEELR
ncbi:hypothetical protein GWG54_18560 [Natronococcus sp. JC468]|uniref:hypothetical protein n=1 Tax=Natronococcus sp. JC468 TaxID=1961921 RepID=UPI00143A89E2|nr:hypothetical protein [Natronococcus sp. JC468]NKE37768.1 hypothetical protein [Natronococcus sp. JC468]